MSVRDQNDGYACVPPRDGVTDERYAWQSGVTGAAAASLDMWSGYAADDLPKGKVWVEFESEVTVSHFRLARTATTATTVSNGTTVNVAAGARRVVYLVDPTKDLFIDVIATGAGVFKWRMCSPEVERSRI